MKKAMKAKPSTPHNKQSKLEALLAKWQKILRLSDWDIEAVFAPYHKIMEGCMAQITPNHFHKRAEIRIMCEADFENAGFLTAVFDPERSIVHELLHIHLATANPKRKEDSLEEEQTVNTLTKALLYLDRRSA